MRGFGSIENERKKSWTARRRIVHRRRTGNAETRVGITYKERTGGRNFPEDFRPGLAVLQRRAESVTWSKVANGSVFADLWME